MQVCFACRKPVDTGESVTSTNNLVFHPDCVQIRRSQTKKMIVVGVSFSRYGVCYIATAQYPKGQSGKDAIPMALRNATKHVGVYHGRLKSARA